MTTGRVQWGVQYHDGSVTHPWNGHTQEQRARAFLAQVQDDYPRDSFALVTRDGPDAPWVPVTPPASRPS